MDIRKTYNLVKDVFYANILFDSYEVVKTVKDYRSYWKPKNISTILLAESHVHTTQDDYSIICSVKSLPDYPKNYVRFVYCLGYGENYLLSKKVRKNAGTPQFWKLLFSCINKIKFNKDFSPITKRGTPSTPDRIQNKIELLKSLRNNGIWLLDASIVGLYPKDSFTSTIRKEMIKQSYHYYIRPLLEETEPDRLIFIGKEVEKALSDQIIPVSAKHSVFQPQAHLKSKEHLRNYQKLFHIIN